MHIHPPLQKNEILFIKKLEKDKFRDHTSPPRDGEPKIQFDTVGNMGASGSN